MNENEYIETNIAYNFDEFICFYNIREERKISMNTVLAEGAGFEPAIRFPAYTLSKRAPSATRPPLRKTAQPSEANARLQAGVHLKITVI